MTNTAVTVACVSHAAHCIITVKQLRLVTRVRLRRLGFTSYEMGVDLYRKLHNGQKPNPGEAGRPA